MCGRFTQNYTWAEVHAFLSVFGPPRNLQPHYNIAPTRLRKDGKRELVSMRWGFEAGDVLTVTRLDRLARSTRDLLNTLAAITDKKAGFRSLGDAWADTTTSHGRLLLTVLGGLAEFERDLIRARTGEGRERARARGVKIGRPPKLTDHQKRKAIKRRDRGNETLATSARRRSRGSDSTPSSPDRGVSNPSSRGSRGWFDMARDNGDWSSGDLPESGAGRGPVGTSATRCWLAPLCSRAFRATAWAGAPDG